MEHCKISNWSFGHPTLRAGPRFPSNKSQGVRCQERETQKLRPEYSYLNTETLFIVICKFHQLPLLHIKNTDELNQQSTIFPLPSALCFSNSQFEIRISKYLDSMPYALCFSQVRNLPSLTSDCLLPPFPSAAVTCTRLFDPMPFHQQQETVCRLDRRWGPGKR